MEGMNVESGLKFAIIKVLEIIFSYIIDAKLHGFMYCIENP